MGAAVLVALALAGCCARAGAVIIGINVDIEDYKHQELYLATVSNCTAMVAAANLSLTFSASVQTSAVYIVGLPNPSSGAGVLAVPTEPYYQQILRAGDEVVIMDYGTDCKDGSCDPTQVYAYSWPWIAYAEFLYEATGKKTDVTVGLGADATASGCALPVGPCSHGSPVAWGSGRFHTETELEDFLRKGEDLFRDCYLAGHNCMEGWSQDGSPEGGPFNHFAIFESSNYENMSMFWPCPPDSPSCAGGHRTGKAVWMYDKTPVVDNPPGRQRDFLRWCTASRVTEVYLGATCSMLRGCEDACMMHPTGAPRPQPNASTEAQLVAFIRTLERQRVTVQLYGGEINGEPSIRCTAAGISLARSLNAVVTQ